MHGEPSQVEVHVLQIWLPQKRIWFDIKDIPNRAECAYIAAKANKSFPDDKFRVLSRSLCSDAAKSVLGLASIQPAPLVSAGRPDGL